MILYDWDVELTLELDFEEASIPIDLNGPRSELIYLVGMSYEGRISFKFTFVYKDVLVITQGCTGVSEQDLSIRLID